MKLFKKKRKGFTLVEALSAIAISGIVVVLVYSVITATSALNTKLMEKNDLYFLGQNVADEVLSWDTDNIKSTISAATGVDGNMDFSSAEFEKLVDGKEYDITEYLKFAENVGAIRRYLLASDDYKITLKFITGPRVIYRDYSINNSIFGTGGVSMSESYAIPVTIKVSKKGDVWDLGDLQFVSKTPLDYSFDLVLNIAYDQR